jgi:hypothetical protein
MKDSKPVADALATVTGLRWKIWLSEHADPVPALALEDMLVEIDVIAVVPA